MIWSKVLFEKKKDLHGEIMNDHNCNYTTGFDWWFTCLWNSSVEWTGLITDNRNPEPLELLVCPRNTVKSGFSYRHIYSFIEKQTAIHARKFHKSSCATASLIRASDFYQMADRCVFSRLIFVSKHNFYSTFTLTLFFHSNKISLSSNFEIFTFINF